MLRTHAGSVMFNVTITKLGFIIASSLLLLMGCNESKLSTQVLLMDTWACPKGSMLQEWRDRYSGQEYKFKAIGCKDISGDRVGYHIAWQDYGVKEHEGGFVKDKPTGEWSYYHKNGELSSRGFFQKGQNMGSGLAFCLI